MMIGKGRLRESGRVSGSCEDAFLDKETEKTEIAKS